MNLYTEKKFFITPALIDELIEVQQERAKDALERAGKQNPYVVKAASMTFNEACAQIELLTLAKKALEAGISQDEFTRL